MRTAKTLLLDYQKFACLLLAGFLFLIVGGCATRMPVDTPVTRPIDSYLQRGERLVVNEPRDEVPTLTATILARANND